MRPELDLIEHADGSQQMFVDGVMMIHGILHHPDDAAEIGDEATEHAQLIHAAKRDLGRAPRGQDFQEQPVGGRIVAHFRGDAFQRFRHQPGRLGVQRKSGPVGGPVKTDEVSWILVEDVVADNVDAFFLDPEIRRVRNGLRAASEFCQETVKRLRPFGLFLLERCANDGCKIADVLGDEKIMFHEPLDVGLPGPRGVVELFGDRQLKLERQPLLGATGEEMQMAADRPEKLLAALKLFELVLCE